MLLRQINTQKGDQERQSTDGTEPGERCEKQEGFLLVHYFDNNLITTPQIGRASCRERV